MTARQYAAAVQLASALRDAMPRGFDADDFLARLLGEAPDDTARGVRRVRPA